MMRVIVDESGKTCVQRDGQTLTEEDLKVDCLAGLDSWVKWPKGHVTPQVSGAHTDLVHDAKVLGVPDAAIREMDDSDLAFQIALRLADRFTTKTCILYLRSRMGERRRKKTYRV